MADPKNITDVIETVEDEVEDKYLYVGQVLDTFQHRGFGPLLLTAALIIVLPTGGIPGVPSIIGILIALLACQILLGRDTPWLPKKVRQLHVKKALFDKGVDKIKPVTQKIDHIIRPRLKTLTCGITARLVGLACLLLALLLPFTEFIPFSDMLPGFAIALLGLGLTARDGLVVAAGLTCTAAAMLTIGYLLLH